jgi:7-cyano-7-deazaguanine synthase
MNSEAVTVLLSGGLDSAVLSVELAQQYRRVHPIYIRHGLHWEQSELDYLERFLSSIDQPQFAPLQLLDMPVGDLYDGSHWSLSGENVPDAATADEAVYLPGRNLMLLTKLAVWCERNGINTIALAPLAGNPFSDNSDQFYHSMEAVIEMALNHSITIIRPYSQLDKAEVIRRGNRLPLELTFSCIRPVDNLHCGNCNKCAERIRAFAQADVVDKTRYAAPTRAGQK